MKFAIRAVATIGMMMGCGADAHAAVAASMWRGGPSHDEINEAFGLFASDLQVIDLDDAQPGEPLMAFLEIEGERAVLDLHPWSNRAPDYRVVAQTGRDAYIEVPPGPLRTLRGDVIGVASSSVSGSLRDYGLEAHISLMPGVDYWLDPVARLFPDADRDLYVIYRSDQAIPSEGRCGNDEVAGDLRPPLGERGGPDIMRSGGVTIHIAELACDADFEYFEDFGSDVGAVEDEINAIINTMNEQYERDVAIRHEITTIIVRSDSADPYSSTNASTMLTELRDHWNASHVGVARDVVQLFTGKEIDGATIGLAYVGVVCTTPWAYGLVQPGGISGMHCKTDLSAHELGHNWNADHCACPSHTMNASLRCANVFHPTETIPQITAFRDSRGCLTTEEAPATVSIDSFTILQGSEAGGNVQSLRQSDNDPLEVSSTTSGKRRRSKTVISMTSPCTDLVSLDLLVESGVSRGGVITRVQMFDYSAGRWRLIEKFDQPRRDSVRTWDDIQNPDRFVRDGDGLMRIRITTVRKDKNYRLKVDHVQITVE